MEDRELQARSEQALVVVTLSTATLMSPVEFSPQSASSSNFGQSAAAIAGDADIEPAAPTTIAKATTLNNCMVDFLVIAQTLH